MASQVWTSKLQKFMHAQLEKDGVWVVVCNGTKEGMQGMFQRKAG